MWGRELKRERTKDRESEGEGAVELGYREGEGAGCGWENDVNRREKNQSLVYIQAR